MIALLIAAAVAVPTPGPSAAGLSVLSGAATALQSGPVYVAPAQLGTIDALAVQQAVRGVRQVQVAVLPAAAAAEAGGDPAAVPGVLSGRTRHGGTLLVLVGNQLEAASTTLGPTDVRDALTTAQPLVHADSASRTAAVTAAVRLLATGRGRGLGDASPEPHSAGNPSGISGLIALVVLVVAGLAAVLVLPLLRRRHAAAPPAPPQRTVYVDTFGRITGVQRSVDSPTAEDGRSGDTTGSPPVETSDRPFRAGEEDR